MVPRQLSSWTLHFLPACLSLTRRMCHFRGWTCVPSRLKWTHSQPTACPVWAHQTEGPVVTEEGLAVFKTLEGHDERGPRPGLPLAQEQEASQQAG